MALSVATAGAAASAPMGSRRQGWRGWAPAPRSNDPELEPRRTARQPADASGAFIYRKGRYTPLEALAGRPTGHLGITNRGQVVGQYVDAAGVLHGYLWEPQRGFRTIDPPGGASNACAELPNVGRVCGTVAADINDRGQTLLPAPGAFSKGRAVPIGGGH